MIYGLKNLSIYEFVVTLQMRNLPSTNSLKELP